MRIPAALFPLTLTIFACQGPAVPEPQPPTSADTTWVGELSITAGDTLFMDCSSGRKYKLTGPALDTLQKRYRYFRTKPGQWMKTWVTGHLGVRSQQGAMDSALYAMSYMHLDGAMRCPPLPRPAASGSYVARFNDPMGERVSRLDLLPNGDATSYTSLANGRLQAEEDGRWGVDSEEQVVVEWPHREHTMLFRRVNGDLVSQLSANGKSHVMKHDGDADRMRGAFGRTARWLAASATANGRPTTPSEIAPSTSLNDLFPTPEARSALRAQAQDSLLLSDKRMDSEWDAIEQVKSVVSLMRLKERRER